MTIEELVNMLTEKGAGLIQTSTALQEVPGEQDLWAILPDGRQYYLGVRRSVLAMSVERFVQMKVYQTLDLSEEILVENKATAIAQFLLSEAGMDLSAYTPYAHVILPRLLYALLDEVYGDRRTIRNT